MPRPQPLPVGSIEERVADAHIEQLGKIADRIASSEGAPPGAGKVSEAQAVRNWGIRDPLVDPDQFKLMLMQQGIPDAAWQHLMLAEEYPDLRADYAQPVQDPDLAEQLTVLAEHPYRAALVFDHSDDDEERVQYADHLDRAYQQKVAGLLAQPVQPQQPTTNGPTLPEEGAP